MRAEGWSDGSGNTGIKCACACVIKTEDGLTHERKKRLPNVKTNNEAEWEGALLAITTAIRLGVKEFVLHTDSQIIVNHFKGIYQIRDSRMKVFAGLTHRLSSNFEKFDLVWVPRAENKEADILAARARRRPSPRRRPGPLPQPKPKKNPFIKEGEAA